MIIRPAKAQDAVACAEIANRVIRETLFTFTTDEVTPGAAGQVIADCAPLYLVAERKGRVVAHAYCKPFRAGPGYRFTAEHTIHLAPSVQGGGLGRKLMTALESAAAQAGVHLLVGAISGANPAGIAFHHKLGFSEAGRLPQAGFKAGQWLDLVFMHKILGADRKSVPDFTAESL